MTNSEFQHLGAAAVKAMALRKDARIQYIRSPRWIGYPRAKEILNRFEDLLEYPKKHRMPNMLLVGHTNNGKSMIVNRFEKLHPAYDDIDGESVRVPVLVVESPPVPSEARFYDAVLDRLFAPYKPKEDGRRKQAQVLSLLRKIDLRVLVIDEIHNMLAGSSNKQREFLNVIKFLGNELKVSIVGAGTKEALRAVNTVQQVGNRFEPVALPQWKEDENFLKLLASFEKMLALAEPSNLPEPKLAMKLRSMSEGYIGELAEILERAAVHAVKTGREKIDQKILADIRWITPSDRKRNAELVL